MSPTEDAHDAGVGRNPTPGGCDDFQPAPSHPRNSAARPDRVAPGAALIFDADDTLWLNNFLFERVIEDYLDWLAHPKLTKTELRRMLDDIEAANALTHGYGTPVFLRSLGELIERLHGREPTPAESREISALAHVLIEHRVELLPGVRETLDLLRGRHTLFLLTKGDLQEQQRKVDHSGIADRFTAVHIVKEKNRDTYVGLVEQHDLDPDRTWMIGNSPKSDIVPARQAGLNAVHIPQETMWFLDHAELDPTDPRIRTLPDFSALVDHF